MEAFRSHLSAVDHDKRNPPLQYTWVDYAVTGWFCLVMSAVPFYPQITDAVIAWIWR